jgi:hypothetical protein
MIEDVRSASVLPAISSCEVLGRFLSSFDATRQSVKTVLKYVCNLVLKSLFLAFATFIFSGFEYKFGFCEVLSLRDDPYVEGYHVTSLYP